MFIERAKYIQSDVSDVKKKTNDLVGTFSSIDTAYVGQDMNWLKQYCLCLANSAMELAALCMMACEVKADEE